MDSKRINIGEKFRRQDLPSSPALQPADYTALPQGAKKIGVICQDGLMKRKADAEVFKTAVVLSSPVEREKRAVVNTDRSISVKEKFEKQDLPISPILQPADYTPYSTGAKKIRLISQVGLMKRKVDAEVNKRLFSPKPGVSPKKRFPIMKAVGLSPLKTGGGSPVAVAKGKPLPNNGILTAVDKFFNWLNKVIGE